MATSDVKRILRELEEQAALASGQLQGLEVEVMKLEKTRDALAPVEGRSMIACGKAFIQKGKDQILLNLKHQISTLRTEKIPELKKARQAIESRRLEAEKAWKECVVFLERGKIRK